MSDATTQPRVHRGDGQRLAVRGGEDPLRPPLVGDGFVAFSLDDPGGGLRAVRLAQDVARPRTAPEFIRFAASATWLAAFPRPDADRMEYLFQIVHDDGNEELICDPGNPLRAPGAFGDRSVIEFPGYAAPAWTQDELPPEGTVQEIAVRSRALRTMIPIVLWTPEGTRFSDALPLLVVHDGPEMADYAQLLRYLRWAVQHDRVPPMHAAFLQPTLRDPHYSASVTYARALTTELLPAIAKVAGHPSTERGRVGMGASLGAVATLHAQRTRPGTFAGMYLQSGSFFQPLHDNFESGFPHWRRLTRFVRQVLEDPDEAEPATVTITCGTVEENLANNQDIAEALRRRGYDVTIHANRDAHTWIGWRDTFDPHLGDLLRKVWS